jgi:hypothetical protein
MGEENKHQGATKKGNEHADQKAANNTEITLIQKKNEQSTANRQVL